MAYALEPSPSERPVERLCKLALAEGLLNHATAIQFRETDEYSGEIHPRCIPPWW